MDGGEDDDALAQSLHACARQLEALCEHLGLDALGNELVGGGVSDEAQLAPAQERTDDDNDTSEDSTVEMAQACLQMLASMKSVRSITSA